MPFFDKDKIVVTLVLERDVVMPGDAINGSMNIVVIEAVKCTALRVQVSGQEMMYRRKQRTNNNAGRVSASASSQLVYSYHDLCERTATVLGEQSGRGGRGSIELEPGSYSYPFSIVMPTDLPPNYAVKEYSYGGSITYKVKAVVDIPMGFDNVVEWPLTVLKNAPLSQIYEARAAPAVVQPVRSDIATCGCAGCYCNHEDDSFFLTTALVAPYVAVVSNAAAAPFAPSAAAVPPLPTTKEVQCASDACGATEQAPMAVSGDPSVITLRVLVENHTKTTSVTSARVKLTQCLRYNNGVEHPITLFDAVIPFQNAPLQPGQATAFECPLKVGESGGNSAYVLPSFAAHYAKVQTTLAIDFPNAKVDDTLHVSDFIKLVSGIDTTNTATPV